MSGSVTIDITESMLLAVVRSFLLGVLPTGTEVVRGLINRVAEPTSPNFVIMTPMLPVRLDTNYEQYQDNITSGSRYDQVSTDLTLQLDVHGPAAAENTQIITTLWRSPYACDNFTASGLAMQPLYTSDPRQMPFVDGENQYELRFSIDAHLEYNPTITTTQQFAAHLKAGVYQVDATYPP